MKHIAELRQKMFENDALGVLEWFYFQKDLSERDLLNWVGEDTILGRRFIEFNHFYQLVWECFEGYSPRSFGDLGSYNNRQIVDLMDKDLEFSYEIFSWAGELLAVDFCFFSHPSLSKNTYGDWIKSCGFLLKRYGEIVEWRMGSSYDSFVENYKILKEYLDKN